MFTYVKVFEKKAQLTSTFKKIKIKKKIALQFLFIYLFFTADTNENT